MIRPDHPVVGELQRKIARRRDAIMRDWPKFRRDASPLLVAEVLSRVQAGLPDNFAPWAPGIVVPSTYLLNAAKARSEGLRAADWNNVDARGRPNTGFFSKWLSEGLTLRVRGCNRFWTVERSIPHRVVQILVYPFGALPVFTRTHEQAMQLAEYCQPCPGGPVSILRWVNHAFEPLGFDDDTYYSLSPATMQVLQDTALGREAVAGLRPAAPIA